MPELLKIDELPFELKVNGVLVESVHIRPTHDAEDLCSPSPLSLRLMS